MAHRTMADLKAALPHILAAPKDGGDLRMIVVRPASGQRETPATARLTGAGGVEGDHWSKGCWRTTEAGDPHPDVQICMMSSRTIEAIAGDPENWAPAGDNLFLDLDLTPDNLATGDRLEIGTTLLEITAEPHHGCQSFIDRYGRDACLFVNLGDGKRYALRGRYARVLRDGDITVGDTVTVIRAETTESAPALETGTA